MKIKNKLYLIILMMGFVTMNSCKARKIKNTNREGDCITQFWKNQLSYDYISLRGKAVLNQNGSENSFSLNVKMKKDSVIWITGGLFGFEGARILITPDSFKLINRMQKTYVAYDKSYLTKLIGFDANIGQIQNILIGNATFSKSRYLPTIDTVCSMKGIEGAITNSIVLNDESRINQANYTSVNRTETTDIQYESFEKFDKVVVPTIINTLITKGPSKISLVINYQSANTKAISIFPFSIPDGYKKN